MFRVTLFACTIFLVCACSHPSDTGLVSGLSIDQGSIELSHGDLKLSSYPPYISEIVGQDSLLLYDLKTRTFALFDLITKQALNSWNFPLDGPNFLDFPVFYADFDGSRLFILSDQYFSIFDVNGELVSRWGQGEVEGMNTEFRLLSFVRKPDEGIIFAAVPLASLGTLPFQSDTTSVFLEFDPDQNSFERLSIFPPQKALVSNPDIGYSDKFAQHFHYLEGEDLYYNFQFSSDVYRYSLNSSDLAVFSAQSSITENTRTTLRNGYSSLELAAYNSSGPAFSRILHDPLSSYFIRLHSEYYKDNDGRNSVKRFLMIFDKEFNVLLEHEVEERVSNKYFLNNGTVYLWKGGQPEEEGNHALLYFKLVVQ